MSYMTISCLGNRQIIAGQDQIRREDVAIWMLVATAATKHGHNHLHMQFMAIWHIALPQGAGEFFLPFANYTFSLAYGIT